MKPGSTLFATQELGARGLLGVYENLEPQEVPEPATMLVVALGLLGMGSTLSRRRSLRKWVLS